MAVLVTGGAGYIGGTFTELLRGAGEKVVVLDNLSRGHRNAVDPNVPFYQGDIGNRELIQRIVAEQQIEAVVHFAAYAYVGESVHQPAMYFENNFTQTAALFETLIKSGVKRAVFSSTCATYGDVKEVPIAESHPQSPVNPYGWSKFFVERMLESFDRAHGLKFVALRYFNAAGALKNRGEQHEPEPHLIPNVLRAAQGKIPHLSIFGHDYPTPDGTAIRDYIHVADLGSAHLLALKHLRKGGNSEFINLGNGTGYSVLEVIEMARKVTGLEIKANMEPRRAGDPPRLVADATKAKTLLGWKPQYPDLKSIVQTAWDWMKANPDGYAK